MNLIAENFNRMIAIFAAILLASIVFSGAITGVAGVFFLVLAVVFLVAGFVSPCSLRESCNSDACQKEG